MWPASNGHRPLAPMGNICMPAGNGGRKQCTKMQSKWLISVLLRGLSTSERKWTSFGWQKISKTLRQSRLIFVGTGFPFFEPTAAEAFFYRRPTLRFAKIKLFNPTMLPYKHCIKLVERTVNEGVWVRSFFPNVQARYGIATKAHPLGPLNAVRMMCD